MSQHTVSLSCKFVYSRLLINWWRGVIRGLLVGNLLACPMPEDNLPVKWPFKKEQLKVK
jgi:hypothetical protein